MSPRRVLSQVDVQALLNACHTPEERALLDLGLNRGLRASEVGLPRVVRSKFRLVAHRAGVEAVYYDLRRTWLARGVVSS